MDRSTAACLDCDHPIAHHDTDRHECRECECGHNDEPITLPFTYQEMLQQLADTVAQRVELEKQADDLHNTVGKLEAELAREREQVRVAREQCRRAQADRDAARAALVAATAADVERASAPVMLHCGGCDRDHAEDAVYRRGWPCPMCGWDLTPGTSAHERCTHDPAQAERALLVSPQSPPFTGAVVGDPRPHGDETHWHSRRPAQAERDRTWDAIRVAAAARADINRRPAFLVEAHDDGSTHILVQAVVADHRAWLLERLMAAVDASRELPDHERVHYVIGRMQGTAGMSDEQVARMDVVLFPGRALDTAADGQ